MPKLCEELELQFLKLETKIAAKIKHVNELYIDEIELLNARFNPESLLEKYSSELNYHRQGLLNQISQNLGSEINNANEIQIKNDEFNKMLTLFEKLKMKKLEFKCSLLRSNEICIWKLINKEFKFGKKFSLSKLIKYKHVLGFSEFLDDQATSDIAKINLKQLFKAIEKDNLEIVKYMIENGADVNAKDDYENTALILASRKGRFEIVKYLVENEAHVRISIISQVRF